jgi:hypothetical protein
MAFSFALIMRPRSLPLSPVNLMPLAAFRASGGRRYVGLTYSLQCRDWNLCGSSADSTRLGRGIGLRRGEYSSSTIGLLALPLDVPAFAVRRRSAEESVRSGGGMSRFRLGVITGSCSMVLWTDGEVRLRSSIPPVLEGVEFRIATGGSGVVTDLAPLLLRGRWTRMVSQYSPSPWRILLSLVTDSPLLTLRRLETIV